MNFCTNCGVKLVDDGSFCQWCGAALEADSAGETDSSAETRPAQVSGGPAESPPLESAATGGEGGGDTQAQGQDQSSQEDHRRHLEDYRKAMAAAWASGRLTPDEEKALAGLALAHHITAEEEARIRRQVLSGLENVSAIDEDVESKTTAEVELEINNNHFYMEGYNGILDLRLRNASDKDITDLKIRFGGLLLRRKPPRKLLRLLVGVPHFEQIQIAPGKEEKGEIVLTVSLSYKVSGIIKFFDAQPMPVVRVLGKEDSPQQVIFDFSKTYKDVGRLGGGNIVTNDLKQAIDAGRVWTANDLIQQKLPERYERIPLRFNYEASEEARHRQELVQTVQRTFAPGVSGPPSPVKALSLCMASGGAERRIHLLSGAEIKLGRQRPPKAANDIVMRPYPLSATNSADQPLIQFLKREHLKLVLRESGLHVVPYMNEVTWVNDQPVGTEGMLLSAAQRWTLNLSGVLKLAALPYSYRRRASRSLDPYLGLMKNVPLAWRLADRAGVMCVRLIREDDLRNLESYLAVFRSATIGTAMGNPIQLTEPGISEVHAAIHHFDGCFWIERICPQCPVTVGWARLARGTLAPLVPGTPLEIGQTTMQVETFEQRFL